MRPRRSIDYSAAQAPGTPKWLKNGSNQGHSEASPQGEYKAKACDQGEARFEGNASSAGGSTREEGQGSRQRQSERTTDIE